MKKYLLAGFLLLGTCMAHAQAGFIIPRDAEECSNLFFRALLDEDYNTLNNILSDDFSIVSFNGQQIDRATLSGAVAQGYLTIETGMLSGVRTRTYGNVGIVTGIWNVKGKLESSSFQNQVAYTVVSVKNAGIWKVVNVQLTPVN
jgi:ketosteroid isomerase-like protein